MLNGKRICVYGRSARRVDDVEVYFELCLNCLTEMRNWVMPAKEDIFFDNEVLGIREHRIALDNMMEKLEDDEYDIVVIPEIKDLASNVNVLRDKIRKILIMGIEVYCMQENNMIKIGLM